MELRSLKLEGEKIDPIGFKLGINLIYLLLIDYNVNFDRALLTKAICTLGISVGWWESLKQLLWEISFLGWIRRKDYSLINKPNEKLPFHQMTEEGILEKK